MEKKILRALIVDDSPDDVEVATMTLRKAGYTLKTQRVQDAAGLRAALEKGEWDVVLSEFAMPNLNAGTALELVHAAGPDIPFIVVTHEIKDADLARVMHAGARDVVLKSQPVRIPPVVTRELQVTEERRLYRRATERLKETEEKHRAVAAGTREALGYCLDGMHIDANQAYLAVFGYENLSELEGIPVMNLIDKSDQARFKDCLRKAPQGPQPSQEYRAIRKDGSRFQVELTAAPIVINGEKCAQILANDISQRKTVEDRLQYLSQRDPLTGLYNRNIFLQELTKAVERARTEDRRGGFLYIDITQLKEINTTFGPAAGDRLLLKVTKLLRERLGEVAVLSRFSGDEFAVLLHDLDEARLRETAVALQKALLEMACTEAGRSFRCHSVFSAVPFDKSTASVQSVLAAAYAAAQQARAPRPEPAPPPAPEAAKAAPAPAPTNGWAARVQTALERNEFQLHYQPIINLHGETVEQFEVLLRLVDDKGEQIEAGHFMPAAEQAGLAPAIDRWVANMAVRAIAEMDRGGRKVSLFVNLSPATFEDAGFLDQVQKDLKDNKVGPELVVFEADESAVVANLAQAKPFIQAVKKIGCRFTVDNFGTSLATLNQLRDLPVQFLKISGAIVRNLSEDKISQASLKAVIELAQAVNKKTIAKNVEKAGDMSILFNLGVDYVQGNYFQEADAQMNYEFSGGSPRSAAT